MRALTAIDDHHAWKEWVNFDGLSVVSAGTGDANADRIAAGGGRIRVDGMSDSAITAYLGLSRLLYQVEFDALFLGMKAVHFRNHFYDQSFTRDHAGHAALLWVVARGVALLVGAIVGCAAHAADRSVAGRSRTVCCRSVTRSCGANQGGSRALCWEGAGCAFALVVPCVLRCRAGGALAAALLLLRERWTRRTSWVRRRLRPTSWR